MSCIISIMSSSGLVTYPRQINVLRASQILSADSLPSSKQDVQQKIGVRLDRVASPSMTVLIFRTSPCTTSRVCVAVVRASSRVSRSSLCRTDLTSFSPRIFFTNFTAPRSVERRMGRDALTWSPLFDLLGNEGDRRKYFYHYVYDDFSHGRRRG